ncbi:MAG: DUF4445 domain-containing protein, partial [Lachnospiraceae bacterium]|nr:DUF4445 domain-containing protein [Lachnospiraceae bacterium]
MPEIRINGTGKTYFCRAGENLLKVLVEGGEWIDNACNGKGSCGKCRVRILSGSLQEESDSEKRLLSEQERADGIRLACMVEVCADMEVLLLQKEERHHVLTEGYLPENFTPESRKEGLGAAVDIGTTTVVVSLVNLKNGEEIANASMINAQKKYGLDVLTRITYEYENGEAGIKQLQETIVSSLNDLLGEACTAAGVLRSEIREIAIAANCTMMHMLLGVDARSIGKSPFRPVFTEAKTVLCSEIGLKAGEGASLYCLPQVSGYIGADIVAGAYVCELDKTDQNVLFIDIGTNGEIVLSKKGELLCCSCAAGPALEGMNIRSGMRASEGAVEEVTLSEKGIRLKTIGDLSPRGICGSGILA